MYMSYSASLKRSGRPMPSLQAGRSVLCRPCYTDRYRDAWRAGGETVVSEVVISPMPIEVMIHARLYIEVMIHASGYRYPT